METGKKNDMKIIKFQIQILTINYQFDFFEYFVPYQYEELLNFKISGITKKVISKSNQYDLGPIPHKLIINEPDSLYQYKNTNTFLDIIFSSYLAFDSNDSEMVHGFSFSEDYSFTTKEQRILYIGLYTELIKLWFEELKLNVSLLLNFVTNSESPNKEQILYIKKIAKNYNIKINNSINNHVIKELISEVFNRIIPKDKLIIDLSDLQKFLELLDTYKSNKHNYLDKKHCFCLANNGNNYYYALSGKHMKSTWISNLSNKLSDFVKNEFNKTIPFQPCFLNANVLSYGTCINLEKEKKFIKHIKPIKYREAQTQGWDPNKLGFEYSCCERKIFSYSLQNKNRIDFYCKYPPCKLCKPALKDNKKKYKKIYFFYFSKTQTEFSILIQNFRNNNFKHTNYELSGLLNKENI